MMELSARRTSVFSWLEVIVIIGLAAVPLFASFPYRVNIFLSWEGAYRLSQGQVPYRDFGMPLGYMFWVVPAFFMKLFGAQLISLVKAQVFINVISGFAFRSILKSVQVAPGLRLLGVLLYVLSFSFFNFWPWYNHTVIVYEFVAIAFLLRGLTDLRSRFGWVNVVLAGAFTFFSFFTKQDGGGMAFVLALALLTVHGFYNKLWMPMLTYVLAFFVVAAIIILPLTRYNFGYWFNHGQAPHTARVNPIEIAGEFLAESAWIKFYLFIIGLILFSRFSKRRQLYASAADAFLLTLTLGILAQATVLQVTSYTPPDNNIYFHSFAIVYILVALAPLLQLNFFRWRTLFAAGAGILLWWSGTYWKYFERVFNRLSPVQQAQTAATENVVNRHTYKLDTDSADVPLAQWTFSGLWAFEKVYLPAETSAGIHRLLKMPQVTGNRRPVILNMSELTPLAAQMPYALETGEDQPLWYHLGVAMFNKEAAAFETKIRSKKYDLVLFEYVPSLNNFYPFRVRDVLRKTYQLVDAFPAPRRGDTHGIIEVYVR